MLPILFVTVFLDLVGFGIIVPFLAYYVESFGAKAAVVGLLMSSYSLAQFVFAPIWGRVSDRVGRRPILLLGLAGSVAGFTVFGLATTLSMLFVGRIAMGIFGATIPTAQAAVADVTSPQDRARGMGLIGAAIGLGFILGPALGGILTHLSTAKNPYALPCLAAAGLAALNLVAAAFFLPESLPAEARKAPPARAGRLEQLARGLTDPHIRTLVLIYFLFMLGFTMMEATLTLFIENRIGSADHAQLVRRVGYLFGFIGVIQVALQGGLVGRLARRFGEPRLLLVGCLLAMVSLGSVPMVRSWGALYLVAFGLAAAGGLAQPAVAALISKAATVQTQGGTLGTSQSASSLARVLGPVIAGALFQQLSAGAPYVVAASLALGAAVCVRLDHPLAPPGGEGDFAPRAASGGVGVGSAARSAARESNERRRVMRAAVIGGGSWGTALASVLAHNGHDTIIWAHDADVAEALKARHENPKYLPGLPLGDRVTGTHDLGEALHDAEIVVAVNPSHVTRAVMRDAAPVLPRATPIVCATKGIENESLLTMYEVLEDVLPTELHPYVTCLSGPSFAKETVLKMPTAVVVASPWEKLAQRVQRIFSNDYFRVYSSVDVAGVELGGSLKNVCAIAAGISDGMGFGSNTRAAIMTRGLAELVQLAIKKGANPITLSGLAGMGDLVLTCTGELSRNRTVGLGIGRGQKLSEVLAGMTQVAEGVRTAKSVHDLSRKMSVEMPLHEAIYKILYEDLHPRAALQSLTSRELKSEFSLH